MFQSLKSYESTDKRFTKIKIWLMHTGRNFNGSVFSKEVAEKAIPSLANTPVLSFIEENNEGEKDYSDHRMVLELNVDNEVKLRYLGSAIGVIPENNNAKWEMRLADNGEELEYLTVEALLWNKWDDPVDILKRRGKVSQSMELSDSYTGFWEDDGTFHFESFEFFGACLLGEDVMPAMKNSTAEIHFSKNKNIKETIEAKLEEFNTLFTNKGGEEMTEKIERDYEKTEVLHENKEEEKETEVDIAEDESEATNKVEDDKSKDNAEVLETSSDKPESTFEDEGDDETEPIDSDEGEEEIEPEPDPEPEEPEVDTSELEELVNSSNHNSDDYTEESYSSYSEALATANSVLTNADSTQEDVNSALQALQDAISSLESKPEPEAENSEEDDNTSTIPNQPKRKKVEDFESKYIEVFEQLSKAQKELDELKEYKRQREESDLKIKFEGQLSEDEFKQVFSNLKESSIEDIEKELFALVGKKNFSLSKSNEQINKIPLEVNHNESNSENPYSALEIYIKK